MKSFGVVGCGKMGQALVSGMKEVIDVPVICCDVAEQALDAMKQIMGKKAKYTTNVEDVAKKCDVVLVAVKPAQAAEVLQILGKGSVKQILSIVAGIKHSTLCEYSAHCEVVRIMPNTPALVSEGSIVVFDSHLNDGTKSLVQMLFSRAGHCHFIAKESMMDAVTGLSGSSPALFAMMSEALADAGVVEGLPRDLARDLARETMLGTAKLLEIQHPAVLKENVMSPGGTTAAGVLAAEKEGFRSAAAAFVVAASQKSRSMN